MAFDFDLGGIISDFGKSLAGSSGESSLGGLIGNVINVAGSDGWDGIVNQVTNSNSPLINQAVGVLKDNVGDQWDPFINGVKGLADGDPNAVAGAAIGGLRDWAGPERFDEIATGVGQVINGNVQGAANALLGEVAEAVDNDTFTAIVEGANALGFTQLGDAAVGEAVGELRELVGESAWEKIDLAADVHADLVEGEQAETDSPLSEDPVDGLIDPFEDEQAETDTPLSEDPVDGLIDPFEDTDDDSSPSSPFGDTPLEDILEPSPINPDAPFEPSKPFGDTPLEDILEPSPITPSSPFGDTPLEDILEPSPVIQMAPNTGIAPEHLVGGSAQDAVDAIDGDAVGDFTMGTGFPGGPPLPQTREFLPLEPAVEAPVGGAAIDPGFSQPDLAPIAPAVETAIETVVAAEPVTALAAEVATADSYTAQVDSFFDDVDSGAAPADDGAEMV